MFLTRKLSVCYTALVVSAVLKLEDGMKFSIPRIGLVITSAILAAGSVLARAVSRYRDCDARVPGGFDMGLFDAPNIFGSGGEYLWYPG